MDTLRLNAPQVKMVAHRGLSGLEPENTCAAFIAAGNRSYFGIETDVHRTADGQYIIIHDDNTRRVALQDMVVEETDYATLRGLRVCDMDGQKGRNDLVLPSLREYVQLCRKYEKTSVLELKNHFEPADIDAILHIVRSEGWLDNTIFISFDLPNMLAIRERLPSQKCQFLISGTPDWLLPTLKEHRLDLDIHHTVVTPELVQALHAEGLEVNVWTVNTLEDARRMVECGVDYITTNIVE